MRGIMLTISEIDEENRFYNLPRVHQELEVLRTNMMEHKIPRIGDENPYNRTFYEDAVSCTIFHAVERGELTEELGDELYKIYVHN